MLKSISIKIVLTLAASALLLAACGKDEEEAKVAAFSADAEILQFVPADSPYVFANVEPLPDDLMDKLEPKLDRLLQSYRALLKAAIADKQEKDAADDADRATYERANAVLDELMTLMSIEGMREAGIGRDATGVIYGNGLLPVARVELSDGALFDDAIARLEAKANQKLSLVEVGGHEIRYVDFEEIRIVIGVINDQAVISVVPAGFDDTQLAQVLGVSLPKKNIADAGTLQKIASEYGFTSHYVGYFDVTAIAERFVGAAQGLDADLLALIDHDPSKLSDVCRDEIRSVAAIVPRMVMGYTELSTEKLDTSGIIELRKDIAAELQKLPAAVPGLGGDKGALMSFGMGIDVKAARDFFEARLDAMEAQPFECEHFAELQAGVAGGRQALNQPVPPMVYDFKGFLAVIDNIEGLDVATQTPPTSIDGSFLLAMDNAQALVAMGAMFSPELASMNLQPDSTPVALNMPQMQAMGISAFAALSDDALAISVGDESESKLEAMLAADVPEQSPFLSFSMDAARYYSFIGEAMAVQEPDDEHGPSPEMTAAMQEVMTAIADVYDRMSADFRFTERGIEIESTVTLQD